MIVPPSAPADDNCGWPRTKLVSLLCYNAGSSVVWFYEVCAGFLTLPPDGYLGRLPTKKLNEYPVIWRTNRQKSLSSTSSSSDMNDNVHDFMFLFSFSIQGLSYFFEPPILVRENIGGFPANFLYLTYIMLNNVTYSKIFFFRHAALLVYWYCVQLVK